MSRLIRAPFFLYFTATFSSIMLSIWLIATYDVINPDGICYLKSAAVFNNAGFVAAKQLCGQAKWPFYSILIASLVKLSAMQLSYFSAAMVINSFFSLLTVLVFISIVRHLTPSIRVQWLALFVIVCAHEFNALRPDVIRDHGYWAFYLLSLYILLKFSAADLGRWVYAILWGFTIGIATLFRIEGAMFILLIPVWAFFFPFCLNKNWIARFQQFLQLETVFFIGLIGLFFWHHSFSTLSSGRFAEVIFQLKQGPILLVNLFLTRANALGSHVLSIYSASDAVSILFVTLFVWYFISIFLNLTFVYAILVIFAWYKNLAKLNRQSTSVIWSYITVNGLITAIFFAENMFLSKRYLIALSLTLMLWVPFALDRLLSHWRQYRIVFFGVLFLIFYYAISGVVHFGPSKKYLREAGDWLATHATQKEKIYSNDYQLLYYTQHIGNEIFALESQYNHLSMISDKKWQAYDWLALQFNHHEIDKGVAKKILQDFPMQPIVVFYNNRGDTVYIFHVVPVKKVGESNP